MEKIIEVAYRGTTLVSQNMHSMKIPIRVGDNEVALLKKMRMVQKQSADGAVNNLAWALYRKSDDNFPHVGISPELLNTQNTDIVISGYFWHECFDEGATFGVQGETIDFPEPGIVLIRQPQVYFYGSLAGSIGIGVGFYFYYEIKKVPAKDMVRYMVRDKGDNKG